jgi:cytochrome P450
MQTLAIPLPSQVICELVGVPPALRADVLRLSRLMAAFVADLHAQVEVARRAQHSAKELHLLLRDVFLRCRACPGDDLISELAPLVRRDSSEEEDLLAQCMILLVTGHETTSGLLANCLLSLLTHRAQWRLLQREPSLVDQAVEETLRYESPAQYVTRVATEDLRLHGQSVQRGQPLVLLLGSANRDTSHFKEPDRFDITRQDNRHLAFGHGVHHCLGAHLARMEARIALATFLRCFPNAQLDREVSWMEHLGLRAPRELFLRVHG